MSLSLPDCHISNLKPFLISSLSCHFGFWPWKKEGIIQLFIYCSKIIIKIIHYRLYSDQLKPFEPDYDYVPHMTVGRVSSMELLEKAFAEVDKSNYKFRTVVNKITDEMIGEHKELIIIIEHELK